MKNDQCSQINKRLGWYNATFEVLGTTQTATSEPKQMKPIYATNKRIEELVYKQNKKLNHNTKTKDLRVLQSYLRMIKQYNLGHYQQRLIAKNKTWESYNPPPSND